VELGRSWSCSRIANGCRSRQAARGPSRPRAKSAWTTRRGLAAQRESACAAKERRKPVRRGKAAIAVAGSETIGVGERESAFRHQRDGRRASALHGAPVDGRRLGSNSPLSFDERAEEAVLVSVGSRVTANRRGRQGTSEVTRAAPLEKTTLPWGGRPQGQPDASPPERATKRITVSRGAEAGSAPSSAGQSGSDCRKAVRRHAGELRIDPRFGPRKRARVSARRARKYLWGRHGESRVLGSRAIHGCSCRKSVAEVGEEHLPRAPTRGAARQTEGARGSTGLWLVPWTRPSRWFRAKGCEGFPRERNRDRETLHSAARSRIEPMEGVLGSAGVTSNRVASSRVLAS
jgi:hypothetical protein